MNNIQFNQKDIANFLNQWLDNFPVEEKSQLSYLEQLDKIPEQFLKSLVFYHLITSHPFLNTNCELFKKFEQNLNENHDDLFQLIKLRNRAKNKIGKKILVICAPKSGSSFISNLISKTLDFASVNLNTFAQKPSPFGINGREQEICEFSFIRNVLHPNYKGNFVAQHHIRASEYLVNQINYFDIKPIITTRNIFDSLVSMDDMIMAGKISFLDNSEELFVRDSATVTIPTNYQTLTSDERYSCLVNTYGYWCISFYLSWKRFSKKIKNGVCFMSYENHILNKIELIKLLNNFLDLNIEEKNKLDFNINNFDKIKSRFNKGISGRGKAIPKKVKAKLESFSKFFSDELSKEDLLNLFGYIPF